MFHFPQEKCILNKLKYINYQQQHNYQQHKPSTPVNIRRLDGATSATDITEHLNKMSLFEITKKCSAKGLLVGFNMANSING